MKEGKGGKVAGEEMKAGKERRKKRNVTRRAKGERQRQREGSSQEGGGKN